jgi:hypothetical protein
MSKEHLTVLTPKERLEGLSPEDVFQDELLNSLSPEQIDQLQKRLQAAQSSRSHKSRRKH